MLIVQDDLSGSEIRGLLQLHAEDMLASSPPGTCHFLDIAGLQVPEVTFWSMWDDDDLAGCGALLELDEKHGEVKSMRTADAHRGRGVGRSMLEHIAATATSRGYERLSLETGSGEPFAAATRLYETFGFESCGPFGDYQASAFNRFYTLTLD